MSGGVPILSSVPVRVLTAAHVRDLLPSADAQVELAAAALRAAAGGRAQTPPKPAIHPRPGAFLHAMPAYLEDTDSVALKWISGYPGNPERGLPYLQGLVILNDPGTGIPTAIMDAAVLTAARTAAVSAVCAQRWAPSSWEQMGIVGVGVQGRAHATLFSTIFPAAAIRGYDPNGADPRIVDPVTTRPDALLGAEVAVTAMPMQVGSSNPIDPGGLAERWLILPIDFDAAIGPDLLREADAFFVDDIDQFRHYREQGWFRGWPEPDGSVGSELDGDGSRPDRVVCVNLGLGAVDAAFAAAVGELAVQRDAGTICEL